jgi:hypothetical protein
MFFFVFYALEFLPLLRTHLGCRSKGKKFGPEKARIGKVLKTTRTKSPGV